MHPPSALSTQNSPFNPDRRSPKSVAAVSVGSVPLVEENPCLDCANLFAKSSVFNTFEHGSSPLTARHSPLSYNSVRRVLRGTQGERPLLCSAPARSWPALASLFSLFAHSFFAKSFSCHSYENTRGGTPLWKSSTQGVPKWNRIHETTTCKPPCSHPTVPPAAIPSPRAVTAARLSPASVTATASCTNVFTVPWF